MAKHTVAELRQMQAMPLNVKVRMTENRIRGWVEEFGEDGVHASFSGGKDSTVLLDIARRLYPNLPAIFVDTGLEYPEIREFVKTFDNVEWLKPKKTFKQVIEKYGYPFISKQVSSTIYGARKYLEKIKAREPENLNLKKGIFPKPDKSIRGYWRYAQVVEPPLDKSKPLRHNYTKYQFFLDAPFPISARCCDIMKKAPIHAYERKIGKKSITAQMAEESLLRQAQWTLNGCNGFEMKTPISNPMAFWTNQDVLCYIKTYDLPICPVYGDIVEVEGKSVKVKDEDLKELFDLDRPFLKTTGLDRTGCMFCGYGCHLEKPGEGRFLKMKETHPKQYDYIMRPKEQGGLNYKEVIDWINEHGGFHIEY